MVDMLISNTILNNPAIDRFQPNERHGTLIDPPVSVPKDMQTRNNAGKTQEEEVYHAIWLAAEAASATSHALGHLSDKRLGLHLI